MTTNTQEQPKKPNPDYSKTAVKLCNPGEVMDLLVQLHQAQATIAELDSLLIENETYKALKAETDLVNNITSKIKEAIDQFGSYQDIESGEYAVKYAKKHKEYHVEPFKERFPKLVDAVVEEAINVKALEGLVKGGLIEEETLRHPLMINGLPVITETESFAFYIR